jgi:hypothetical protein
MNLAQGDEAWIGFQMRGKWICSRNVLFVNACTFEQISPGRIVERWGAISLIGSDAMAKFDNIEARRPHCPDCDMRMFPTKPGGNEFKCFRCNYVGSPVPQRDAAE